MRSAQLPYRPPHTAIVPAMVEVVIARGAWVGHVTSVALKV